MKKEYYPILGMFIVFVLLFWPLMINNISLAILAVIFAVIGAVIGVVFVTGITVAYSAVFIIFAASFVASTATVGLSIAVASSASASTIVAATSSGAISIATCAVIIIVIIISINLIGKEEYKVIYIIQCLALVMFFLVSFNIIVEKDFTVIEFNDKEIVLKKGQFYFNSNMSAEVKSYNLIYSKVIEKDNFKVTLAVELNSVSKKSLEEMELFKNYNDLNLSNDDFIQGNPRERIQTILDEKFPNLDITITKVVYNQVVKPIVWR